MDFGKLERYRKAVVAVAGAVLLVANNVVEIVSNSDYSNVTGVVNGVLALLTAFGVYQVPNAKRS